MDFNERQRRMRELQRGAGFTEEAPAKEIPLPAPEYKNANRPKRQEETEEERAIRLEKWRNEYNKQRELWAEEQRNKYNFPDINGMFNKRQEAAPVIDLVDPSELDPPKKMPLIPNRGIGVPKEEDDE